MRNIALLFASCCSLLLFTALRNKSLPQSTANEELKIEETFLSLDSVWTPGKPQKFSLHPFDNYLWIKNGIVTFMVDEVRGKSFRGLINNVKVEEKDGKTTTSFTVRNAKMKVEIQDLGNDRFEIFTYNYLDKYERMFTAIWVDVSKIQFDEDE
jgi:hypothetical protein